MDSNIACDCNRSNLCIGYNNPTTDSCYLGYGNNQCLYYQQYIKHGNGFRNNYSSDSGGWCNTSYDIYTQRVWVIT